MSREYKMESRLVQGEPNEEGAVNQPIYQTNAFEYETAEELEAVFANKKKGYNYTRVANPTNTAFEKKIADLEGGIGAVSTSSGMAAISTAVLSLVEQGDQIIAGNSLFGGTYNFFKNDLKRWGIDSIFVETTELEAYRKAINSDVKLIFLETVGNPKLDIADIEKIAEIAHQHHIPLMIDNTFMTPYLFKAKDFGVDIVINSTSKFINGSSNSIGGVITDTGNFDWYQTNNKLLEEFQHFGAFAFLAKVRQDMYRNLGVCSSPINSYLNGLGVETLALRMDKHCSNALKLAEFLQGHSEVKKINYPGLKNNPFHQIAKKQFGDKFGGLLTFEVESKEKAFKVINKLELAKNLSNLGDVRTLVIHPASTIYHNLSSAEQKKLGVTPALIRVSAGIESPDDIIFDFKEALN